MARKLQVQIVGDASSLHKAFGQAQSAGTRFGKNLTRAVTLPVIAGFGLAIKAAGDFESSLNDMQAVSGATRAQMAKVGSAAKALGADVKLPGTSAKDAADAMTQLAKGGFSAKDAMDAARGTLVLSAAAGIENARAATIQVEALRGFGLGAREASKVSDLLAASANSSTSSIDDMAVALKQSAAVAHQAGMPIEDAVTALSNLANAGIKGSDAGTSLKTMLLRLMAPMGKGAAAVKDLGLQLRDQSGELKKIPALAQEFTAKTKDMEKAERDAAFAAIFGTDAIRAANILLGKGADAHEKMKKKVTEQGAAAKLAAAKMKGFNGAIEAFKSAAETAAISIGTILLPMATALARKATDLVGRFESLSVSEQKMAMKIAAIAAAAGPALVIMSKLHGMTAVMGGGFGRVLGPLGLAAFALAALGASSESSRASLMQMGDALAPLAQMLGQVVSSPITLWMVAAGAAALGLVKGIMAIRVAMLALTAAAATNPLGAFAVGAGLVLGAIIGVTSALGGGASAMDRFRSASDAAKAALDRLKASALELKGAQLAHQAAILEVKSASQGLVSVQQQVNAGEIKGKDASLALEQAKLRVRQANLGVQTTSKGVKDAIGAERAELVAHNSETARAIAAAKDRVAQLKGVVAATGGTVESVKALKDAETNLAIAMARAGKVTADTAGNVRVAGSAAESAAVKVVDLKGRMDALKSKALRIDVNTEQAMFNVLRLVGSMLQVASKTVTLTVKTKHVKGSWNDQETIENLRKEPTKRAFQIDFRSSGTGPVQTALAAVAALQGQLDRINARRAAQDRALAVSEAQRALAEAKKKNEGIAAAERALVRARQDIVVAGIEKRLAAEQRGLDRETALLDRMKENLAKVRENLGGAFDVMADRITRAFDKITSAWTAPADGELGVIQARRQAEDQAEAVADAERALAAVRANPEATANEIADAERALARAREDITVTSLEKTATAQRTAWEQERSDLRERLDDRLAQLRTSFTTEGAEVEGATGRIVAALGEFGVQFADVGALHGEQFLSGLRASIDDVALTAGLVVKAKKKTKGKAPKAHAFASGGIVTRPTLGLVGEAGPEAIIPLSRAGGGRAAAAPVINLTVNGWVGDDRALVERIRAELIRGGRRMPGVLGGLA